MKYLMGALALVLGMFVFTPVPAQAYEPKTGPANCDYHKTTSREYVTYTTVVCNAETWQRKRSGRGMVVHGTKVYAQSQHALVDDCPIKIRSLVIEKPSGVDIGKITDVCMRGGEGRSIKSFVWPHTKPLDAGRATFVRVKVWYTIDKKWGMGGDVNKYMSTRFGYRKP